MASVPASGIGFSPAGTRGSTAASPSVWGAWVMVGASSRMRALSVVSLGRPDTGSAILVVGLPLWARLGLRNRPPSFEDADFLPSPSVASPSEIAPVFFSFFVPRVLKNDWRRLFLPLSGVVAAVIGDANGEVIGAEVSVVVAAVGTRVSVVAVGTDEAPVSTFSSALISFFS